VLQLEQQISRVVFLDVEPLTVSNPFCQLFQNISAECCMANLLSHRICFSSLDTVSAHSIIPATVSVRDCNLRFSISSGPIMVTAISNPCIVLACRKVRLLWWKHGLMIEQSHTANQASVCAVIDVVFNFKLHTAFAIGKVLIDID
jgi:hypothetical protein